MRIKKSRSLNVFTLQVETNDITATLSFTHVMRTISPFVVELKHEEEHKASIRISHPERFWAECESMSVPVIGSPSKAAA